MKVAVWVLLFIFIFTAAFSAQTVQANPDPAQPLEPDAPQGIPPLGQPGLSWRFADVYGQSYVPYPDEPYHLNTPHGIAAVGETVWVTERIGKRALQFNAAAEFLQQIGRSMNGLPWVLAEIDSLCDVAVAADNNIWLAFGGYPTKVNMSGELVHDVSGGPGFSYGCLSLAVDASDRLYVADAHNNRLTVYDSGGSYLKTIGEGSDDPVSFLAPEQIAVAGNTLYVADSMNNRIVIIDTTDFDHFRVTGQLQAYVANAQPDGFNRPSGVALDASRLFVVDRLNHRVQVFDRSTLLYLVTIGAGGQGTANNQWDHPYDIAIDAGGNIYVSDESNHRLQQFAPDLTYLRTLGQTQVPYLTDEHYLNKPSAVQADSQGNLYVAERSAHRVVKLAPDGSPLGTLGQVGIPGDDQTHFSYPSGLAVDALDRLYVTDTGNNRIVVFSPAGSYLSEFGSQGTADNEFNSPADVAISPLGDIVVADPGNRRVQVFSSDWTHELTIGETGVSGMDDAHFESPRNVAVGPSGAIYVLDINVVQRVQKCVVTDVATCTNLTGKSGDGIDDYEEFDTMLSGLAVDSSERVYLPTFGPASVVVYDTDGNFMGMLGGGPLPSDVTFDPLGNLFMTSSYEHVVTKFASGVTYWKPVNVTAFGDIDLMGTPLLVSYNGDLYSGHPSSSGAQVWRMDTSGAWSNITPPGVGDPLNTSITSGLVFNNRLYLGTANAKDGLGNLTGGMIYRYDGSTWTVVASGGLGTPTNYAFSSLAEFNGAIYASACRGDSIFDPPAPLGAHIWRSPSGDDGTWVNVLDFSTMVPPSSSAVIQDLQVFNGFLYAAVGNAQTGSELWRSSDGLYWVKVLGDGFGLGSAGVFTSLEPHGSYLYLAGGDGSSGARLWRCQQCDMPANFEQVVQAGFDYKDLDGNALFDNTLVQSLFAYGGYLYAWAQNQVTGNLTWRSRDGLYWDQLAPDDFDTPPGYFSQLVNPAAALDGKLYLGLGRSSIWQLKSRLEVFKTGTGSGNVTSAPSGIDCGPICSAVFPEAASVTLFAAPASGSVFSGWSGEGCSGMVECTVSVDRIRTVSAEFNAMPDAYSLAVQKQGDGVGLVASNPPGIDCGADCQYTFASGTVVNLTAVAERGTFTGWSGDCTGTGVCRVTISGARNVIATFTQHPPLVSGFSRNGVQDTPILFTSADFATHFTDSDGDGLVKMRITAPPVNGALWIGDSALSLDQVISFSQLSSLVYQPNPAYLGEDTFSWKGSDGLAYSLASALVTLSVLQDDDGDAVGSQVEASVPPLDLGGTPGDGNGDGLADATQSNVASLLVGGTGGSFSQRAMAQPVETQYITLAAPSPSELRRINPMPYPASNPAPPANFEVYPIGFVQLEITAVPLGGSVALQLYHAGVGFPDSVFAFGSTPGNVLPHWYEFLYDGGTGAEFTRLPNDKVLITLHYQDGGRGDNDLSANGFVTTLVGCVVTTKFTYLPLTAR